MHFRLYLHRQIDPDRRLCLRRGGNGETHAMSPIQRGWLHTGGDVPAYPLPSRLRPLP